MTVNGKGYHSWVLFELSRLPCIAVQAVHCSTSENVISLCEWCPLELYIVAALLVEVGLSWLTKTNMGADVPLLDNA